MKVLKMLSCLLIGVGVTGGAAAGVFSSSDTLNPHLYLKTIHSQTSTEKGGDELYLAITEFHPKRKNLHYTIPHFPLHWPEEALTQVTNLKLWKTTLVPKEATEVVVGFVEHDMPPWNTDDMIGSVKIKLLNKEGQLKALWIPLESTTKEINLSTKESDIHHYILKGGEGHYEVELVLKPQGS